MQKNYHFFSYHFGLVSTPSYSLLLMYSSVRWKCLRGDSRLDVFSLVLRFEWISSIRPLMYFVVTYRAFS